MITRRGSLIQSGDSQITALVSETVGKIVKLAEKEDTFDTASVISRFRQRLEKELKRKESEYADQL